MQTVIRYELPWPPSLNRYWRSIGRGRVIISDAGRKYRQAVGEAIGFVPESITARIAVALSVYPPDQRKRDLDNVPKAILDAVTHAGVWTDDSLIDVLHISRETIRKSGHISLVIEILENKDSHNVE